MRGGRQRGREGGGAGGKERLFNSFSSACHEVHITVFQFSAHSHGVPFKWYLQVLLAFVPSVLTFLRPYKTLSSFHKAKRNHVSHYGMVTVLDV